MPLTMECSSQIATPPALARPWPAALLPARPPAVVTSSARRGSLAVVHGDKNKDLGKRVAKAQEVHNSCRTAAAVSKLLSLSLSLSLNVHLRGRLSKLPWRKLRSTSS